MNNRIRKLLASLTSEQKHRIQEEYDRAYDFDPNDPLFGLSQQELSGPNTQPTRLLALNRRFRWSLINGTSSGSRRYFGSTTLPLFPHNRVAR